MKLNANQLSEVQSKITTFSDEGWAAFAILNGNEVTVLDREVFLEEMENSLDIWCDIQDSCGDDELKSVRKVIVDIRSLIKKLEEK